MGAQMTTVELAGGTAILVIHDVAARGHAHGEIGAQLHGRLLDTIAASPLWCAAMGEILARLTARV